MTTGFARGCQGRGVVVRVHSPSALIPQRLIGVRKRLFAWFASGFCGVPGVPTSTTCKSWWGASLRSWFQCIRLLHRTCKTSRGTSLRSWFQKKCLLPMGILIFFFSKIPPVLKLEVGFSSTKKSFQIFSQKKLNLPFIN